MVQSFCLQILHNKKRCFAVYAIHDPEMFTNFYLEQVDNINSAQGYLSEAGVGSLPIGNLSIEGASHKSGMFLQPKDNMGVLIQLQQSNRAHARV
jgi:hypothetical protein